MPRGFSLEQNYPNPFNPVTTITFSLAQDAHVRITVYNLKGQKIEVLEDGFRKEGEYHVVFDGKDLSSGVYLCRLAATTRSGNDFTTTRKLLLIK